MTKRRKQPEQRMGFVDYCRITTDGVVHCNTSEQTKKLIGKPRWLPQDKDEWECINNDWDPTMRTKKGEQSHSIKACRNVRKIRMYSEDIAGKPTPRTAEVGGEWSTGKTGSPFFTSTTKVHAPTWGINPGHSCPVVKSPVLQWLQQSITTGKKQSPKAMVSDLLQKVPNKCLACYATSGNYVYAETQQAMTNRLYWWNEHRRTQEGQDEIVETMVDAIRHAGDERCTERKGCKYIPGVQPKYFRAFDAGDFQDHVDVDLWRRIAEQLPQTKFWFPTTAWEGTCGGTVEEKDKMLSSLRALHKLPHVTVRPSAKGLDTPAARVGGLGAGTAVVEADTADEGVSRRQHRMKHKSKRLMSLMCDKDGENCRTHYICPGSCATCRKCWTKNREVVYKRHGLQGKPDHLIDLVRKVTGMGIHKQNEKTAIFEEADRKIANSFAQLLAETQSGPEPPKLEWRDVVRRATNPTPAELREIQKLKVPGKPWRPKKKRAKKGQPVVREPYGFHYPIYAEGEKRTD